MELLCGCCNPEGMPSWDGGQVCQVCGKGTVPLAKTDFYQYVNHTWLNDESITIPDEYPRWGSFIKLVDEALKNQIGLLTELVDKASNPEEEKLALVWRASMQRFEAWNQDKGDYSDIYQELGHMNTHLASGAADDAFILGLATYLGRCQEIGIGGPLTFGKEANLKDTENMVLDFSPSGMSLPSRDYYLDSKFEEQRGWFKDHLNNVVKLIGADKLEDNFAERVMRLETKIAQVSMKPSQSRQFDQYFTVTTLDELFADVNKMAYLKDKEANYAEHTVDEANVDKVVLTSADCPVGADDAALIAKFLEQMTTEMKLRETMTANYTKNYPDKTDAAEAQYRMMVFDGDFFRRIFCILFRSANRSDVRAYMQYNIISSAKDYCTKPLNEEFFDFYRRKVGGQKEQKTHEKRTVALVNSWVGELNGKVYVSRFFSEEDKTTVRDMVHEVLKIMENSLKTNDWLTEETKAKAMVKLSKFVVKLGYPDKWKNYDNLDLKADDSMFVMQQKVNKFEHQKEFLEKLNSVKDKTKWEMNPQDVNAYFHPLNNEIVFPAAIMQPPFYQRSLDSCDFDLGVAGRDPSILAAINFGGIGAVIAHEITHGYDDQGRKFDSDGNINDWWQEEDAKLFKGKCDLMTAQAETWTFEDKPEASGDASGAAAEPKVYRMNGELTMGENLADLGGMSLAFQALERRLGEGCTKDHKIAFFRSWANIWKSKETKAFIIQALTTDPHAPCSFRGNLLKNVDAFYDAFDVQPGDPMFVQPDKRVKMW